MRSLPKALLLPLAATPFLLALAQQTPNPADPPAEQVFKDIQVFKGMPASEIIPAMEFMTASLKWKCVDCHDPKDYAKVNKNKTEARHMVVMQRELNQKYFNNRLEVTCMTCHNGKGHPVQMTIPDGTNMRHADAPENAPKPADLIAKHRSAIGPRSAAIVRIGTLTGPNDETHKIETLPAEFIQAPGGKFKIVSGARTIGSDGKTTWYGGQPMQGEPEYIFQRMGRTWAEDGDFSGLANVALFGAEKVRKTETLVVRANRRATASMEEMYFDVMSGLLARAVNLKRTSIGAYAATTDYMDYRTVGKTKVPMQVTITFADGTKWEMKFKSVKEDPKVGDDAFKLGG